MLEAKHLYPGLVFRQNIAGQMLLHKSARGCQLMSSGLRASSDCIGGSCCQDVSSGGRET